jgi:hypothetical protein
MMGAQSEISVTGDHHTIARRKSSRSLLVFPGSRGTGQAISTASVAANKGEIFSLACVRLEPIRLTPTIGGK